MSSIKTKKIIDYLDCLLFNYNQNYTSLN